jgi:hypothetical protein
MSHSKALDFDSKQVDEIKNLDYELVVHKKATYQLCTWLVIN